MSRWPIRRTGPLLAAVFWASTVGACTPSCPAGEDNINIDETSYCGTPCEACSDCEPGFTCKFTVSGNGICVDDAFLRDNGVDTSCREACGPGQIRTNDEGVSICVDLCDSDRDCSTCCIATSSGDDVCAPRFAYCPGGGCGPGEHATLVDGVEQCLSTCGSDAECTTCCVRTTDGVGVCSPSASRCEGDPEDPECTDLTGCVTVVDTERGTHCGDPTSVEATFRNDCSQVVTLQYCFELDDGRWDCGRDSMDPGERSGGFRCGATGRYQYVARAVEDWGRDCFLDL